jgi:hypothetical protein
MNNTTFRPFLEKLGGTPANTFIGNNGELFYDPDTTKIRVSDGVTPGGKLIAPAFVNYFDFSSESVTLPPVGTETPWPTYIKLASVTSSTFSRNGLVHVSNNRVTNTSTTSKVVKLEAILSFIPDQTDFINVGAAFFQGNGDDTPIIIPCSEQKGLAGISAQNEITVLPFHCVTELETGDYVEVWVQNLTDETGIKLDNINVIITEL